MDSVEKVSLIRSFAEEIITEEELTRLFELKASPVAYDGLNQAEEFILLRG